MAGGLRYPAAVADAEPGGQRCGGSCDTGGSGCVARGAKRELYHLTQKKKECEFNSLQRKTSGCAYKNQKPQTGRAEVSDFFCIFCNSKNIPVNLQNSEKEGRFSCTRSFYFDISTLFLLKGLIQRFGKEFLGESLGWVLLGLAIFVRSCLLHRGDRHNRFHFISPFICIDCGDPSLDSYLCMTSIWPYPFSTANSLFC